MVFVAATNLRGRARLPVIATLVAAALMAPVAGASAAGSSPRTQFPGFLLDRGRYTSIEVPDAQTLTSAFGINDRGQIAGSYDDAGGRFHGFLRDQRGRFTRIDVPGAQATFLHRINDRGQAVGIYFDTAVPAPNTGHGLLVDRGATGRSTCPGP